MPFSDSRISSRVWDAKIVGKRPKLNRPVLIEGLPGIGSVGKVAADFMVQELKATKLFEINSYTFPHSVFVNENNLVELPQIEIYYKKFQRKKDLLFLVGDVQPVDEVSCYEFCDKVLDLLKRFGGKEVITLGGIGMQTIPKNPKIYITGNSQKMINRFKEGQHITQNLQGVVGPVMGVTGVMLGLAEKMEIEGVALLGETFGHPMYLGVRSSKEILRILNSKLGLKLDVEAIERNFKDIERDVLGMSEKIGQVRKNIALKKFKSKFGSETNYIG